MFAGIGSVTMSLAATALHTNLYHTTGDHVSFSLVSSIVPPFCVARSLSSGCDSTSRTYVLPTGQLDGIMCGGKRCVRHDSPSLDITQSASFVYVTPPLW